MGLTLRSVSERLDAMGEPLPASTLARIESGKLDPGVPRLWRLLELYRIPPHLISDLIHLDELAEESPPSNLDAATLYRQGLEFWKSGNLKRGIAYLFALRERTEGSSPGADVVLCQKAELTLATALRNIGRFRLAKQIVDELLCGPLDGSVRIRALVLASSLWRGFGASEAAFAFIQRASMLEPDEGSKDRAFIDHQHAKLLLESGETAAARALATKVLEIYRAAGDAYNEGRALALWTRVIEAGGRLDEAIESTDQLERHAREHGFTRLETTAYVERGRLLIRAERTDEAIDAIRHGLGQSIVQQDDNAEFQAHYHLWKAYTQKGDRVNARHALNSARHCAQLVDESSTELTEVLRTVET